MSVEQGAFIGSVFLAVFSMALEARVYDRLAGKAARPECHRFVSINRLQAILKHVLRVFEFEIRDSRFEIRGISENNNNNNDSGYITIRLRCALVSRLG